MKCPDCNADVGIEDNFCPYCGFDLKTYRSLYNSKKLNKEEKNIDLKNKKVMKMDTVVNDKKKNKINTVEINQQNLKQLPLKESTNTTISWSSNSSNVQKNNATNSSSSVTQPVANSLSSDFNQKKSKSIIKKEKQNQNRLKIKEDNTLTMSSQNANSKTHKVNKINASDHLKDMNLELSELEQKKEALQGTIEHLNKQIRELSDSKDHLIKQISEFEARNAEFEKKQFDLDKKEEELNQREQALNDKYLELLQFENELMEKKKKIDENELNMFLAKELKDDSRFLANELIDDFKEKDPNIGGKEKQILSLVEFAREFLKENLVDAAIHVYKKIEMLYYSSIDDLPKPTLNKLHLEIVALYDDINLKLNELKVK